MHERTTNILTAVWQYGRCLRNRPRTMLHGPHHQDPILMGNMKSKICRVSHEAGCQGSSNGLLKMLQKDEMRASCPGHPPFGGMHAGFDRPYKRLNAPNLTYAS